MHWVTASGKEGIRNTEREIEAVERASFDRHIGYGPPATLLLPYALTRNVPILVLAAASSMYEDGNFYLQLYFRPELGTHDETGLAFWAAIGRPDQAWRYDRRDPKRARVRGDSGQQWQLGQRRAHLLRTVEITVIEVEVARSTVEELRAALRVLFDRDMPERPRLELTAPPGPPVEQLELPFP
jgi:hypothetical protein